MGGESGSDRKRWGSLDYTEVWITQKFGLHRNVETSGNFNPSWKNGISLFTLFRLVLCLDRLNSSNQVKSRKILLDQGDPFP
jgi:hypothetical protein